MDRDTEQVSPERWAKTQALFHDALKLPHDARASFLSVQCASDADLRRDVEALLAGHEETGAAVDQVIAEVADDAAAARRNKTPKTIGPYRIVRPLGEGGMGTVYLAERDDAEFKQRVAIKVVKNSAQGDEVLRRFRSERQILANLNHPNIAHLLDGGSDDNGLPYIAMEFVEGEPIDEYCDRHRLDTVERIDLFRQVCAAVHVAHQNLIVHRDIKPGNILVTPDGSPKLLDFGIAKLLAPGSAAQTVAVTQLGTRVLTPEHASPEQIQGKPITTASDVYSLGVLLYHLLTGLRPYAATIRQPAELERAICETQPPKPSTAVLGGTLATRGSARHDLTTKIGTQRNTTVAALRKALSGDLDNIVLKTLRKEPQRRYSSVQALSDDLGRYLRKEPVEARAETWRYVATKFLQRNVAAVTAALLALVSVSALIAFYTVQLSHERDAARTEAAKADQIAAFMMELFEVSDPWQTQGETVTARELLDKGAARVSSELADQPEVQARMMDVIGQVYQRLMLFDSARPLLARSLEIREGHLDADHPDVLDSRLHLASVIDGGGDFESARALYRQVLDARTAEFGPDSPQVADVLSYLGNSYFQEADYLAAEPIFRRALSIQRAAQPTDAVALSENLMNIGALLRHNGDYDEAESYYREALQLRRSFYGRSHPDVAESLNHMARLETQRGDYAAAEPHAREALAMRRELLGNEHPAVGASAGSLGSILFEKGDLEGAETLRRESLEISRRAFGDNHLYVSGSMVSLGRVLAARGRLDEAEPLLRDGLTLIRSQFPATSSRLAFPLTALADLQQKRGDYAAAEALLNEALDILIPAIGAAHPRVAAAQIALGNALAGQQRYDEAETLLLDAYSTRLNAFGTDHDKTAQARSELVALYTASGNTGRAAEFRR